MKSDDILELRKDISAPGSYLRAGTRYTRAEWLDAYPTLRSDTYEWEAWFINLSAELPSVVVDLKNTVVNEVFALKGLRSISYKQAAVACITEYQKRLVQLVDNG